jgi:hypothetical protein
MTGWRVIQAERKVEFCPIALDLRDEFTGEPVLARAALTLEVQNGTEWIARRNAPVRSPSGLYLFTGLGRSADPAALPQFHVRVTVSVPGYRPLYRLNDDALEFDVGTYNDQVAPAVTPIMPQLVLMLPSAGYRYAGHIRTLKGRVLDPGGDPVADAEVSADGVERVMTDESGGFTLPLRRPDPAAVVAVSVQHPRSGRSALANFNLPADLVGNHDLTIS